VLATVGTESILSPVARPKGPAKLKAWRKLRGVTQQSFADLVGYHRTQVSGWEAGKWTPGAEEREAIEVITNGDVKASDWLSSEDLQRIARLQSVEPYDPEGGEAA